MMICETDGCHRLASKPHLHCEICREAILVERHRKRKRRSYSNGMTIYSERDDVFFNSLNTLLDYVAQVEHLGENAQVTLDMLKSLRLVHCRRLYPKRFKMEDFYEGILADGQEPPARDNEIIILEDRINYWLQQRPGAYEPSNKAVDVKTIMPSETH